MFLGRLQYSDGGCVGCHQLHQWWDSGASGLPGPVRGAGASAQPAESQRQQNPLAHPGCHLQYSTGILSKACCNVCIVVA